MPSKCDLFYHIEEEQLVIIKTNPLIKREKNNYENISHPFIPIFYGTMKDGQRTSLVIEYINGQTFDNIKNMKLEEDCMFKIIFDLCSIFQYLHKNEYIYRDLKPDNVILDKNNQIVLIDFDRMIQETDINDQDITRDLGSDFAAPEIKSGGTPSYKSDIYSLGKMIVFIIGGNENKNKILLLKHHIFQTYIDEKPENRPSVLNLIQSFSRVLYNLGVIYTTGEYISRDMNKAIHYFSLAANQNDPEAQFNLGLIYERGEYISRDMNKAIHYYSLAANQNDPKAQYNLGVIYATGEYISRDMNKAIHYYSLAANQNHPQAQYGFGLLYASGKYIPRDMNKAIHYYSLAAKQNYPKAQYNLGLIYFLGIFKKQNIYKGIYYICNSAFNGNKQANFSVGFLFHDGKYYGKDIRRAIKYYKEASSFNNQYAKNNLGIIYKNGFGDEIQPNIGLANEYFKEAINQKNDKIAMYNLAHMYLYNEQYKEEFDIIDLLIRSINVNFEDSLTLLCIALFKKYGCDINKIIKRLNENAIKAKNISMIDCKLITNKSSYEQLYKHYKNIDFLYDISMNPIKSNQIGKQEKKVITNGKAKEITSIFYEGFGIDIN